MRKGAVFALHMAWVTILTIILTVLMTYIPRARADGLPAQWTTQGPYGGYIYDLVVSPAYKSDQTIFAATNKGVYKSTDGGGSWSLVNNSRVMALAISPDYSNDRTIWAGYYKSTNGGASWSIMAVPLSVSSLAVSPYYAVDQTIFAGSRWSEGLARSTDGGQSWTLINTGLSDLSICSLAVSPGFVNDQTLFAGTNTAFFKSTDRGQSWVSLSNYPINYPKAVVISPNYEVDQTILVGFWNGSVRKSSNGGQSWTAIDMGKASSLAISPNFAVDQTIFAGTLDEGIFKSTDGGVSWNQVNNGLAIDEVQTLCISPDFANDQTIFAGFGVNGDGIGIYKSSNAGVLWSEACAGLGIPRKISSLAISPAYAQDQTILAGADRNDVFKSMNGSWSRSVSATGSILAISPNYASDRTIFAASWNEYYLSKSIDGGHSWARSNTGLPLNAWWDLAISPGYANDQTLFAAGNSGVYISSDGGHSWAAAKTGLPGGSILEIEISPDYVNDRTLLVGTGGSGVFKSVDGGASWAAASSGLPSSAWSGTYIYSLVISPNYAADRTIFAATQQGVYRSVDGALSWGPVFPHFATAIGISPAYANDGAVFVYDGSNVLMSQDSGNSWSQIDTLPSTYINMIVVSPDFASDRTLFFSTDQGVWTAVIGEYVDQVTPVVVCQDAVIRIGAGGRASITAAQIDAGSSDNCGIASRSVSPASFTCADLGDNRVVLTIEDTSGNTAQGIATVTVLDGLPPVPDRNPLPDITGEGSVTLNSPPTATDNCAGRLTGTTNDPLTYTSPGTYIVRWTYHDSQGNMASQTQQVIVTARAKIRVSPAESIQAAINEAANGAVITVEPGVYRENINFLGKTITLKSTSPTDSEVVAATIIDGGSRGSVVTFDHGEGQGALLSGMTIRNGEGGIACYQSSSPTINNCNIIENIGSGVSCYQGSSPSLLNCVISGNVASMGAAIYCSSSNPSINNCTLAGNAASLGGGIYAYFSCPHLTNSILWNDAAEEIYSLSSAPLVTYSDVQGGYPGEGNIGADPLFFNPAEGDYLLKFASPCIDTAAGAGAPSIDKNGQARPAGNGYDMGAYEYLSVNDSNPPVPDLDPLPDIVAECEVTLVPPTATDEIAGLITATTNDPLTYNTPGEFTVTWIYDDGQGNTSTQTQRVSLTVYDTLSVQPGESIQAAIEKACNGTVITVEPGVYQENINFLGKDIVLKSTDPSDPHVVASTIIDGAGQGSVVTFNQGEGSACLLSGMTIRNGQASTGGGIYCYSSSPTITNCNISENFASSYGGAVYCRFSSPKLINCVLAANSASSVGGAIYCYSSSPIITHCTLAGNSAPSAGGLRCYSASSPVITNCILWDESPEEIYSSSTSSPIVSFSDVRGAYQGEGNIEADPLFILDYHLRCDSPCIDQGTELDINRDKDGVARPQDGDGDGGAVSDMGAYEYIFGTDAGLAVPDLEPLPDIVVECGEQVTPPTATSGCTGQSITATSQEPLPELPGEYIITWVYDNGDGNTTSQTQWLTIKKCPVASSVVISEITASNQTAGSATITWRTNADSRGEVHYSTNSALTGYSTAVDSKMGKIHQVVLSSLNAGQTYYFEVKSGATINNHNGQYYHLTTAQVGLCDNFFIGGKMLRQDMSPRAGELVTIRVNHLGVDSYPLSSMSNSKGIWFFNLADLKNSSTGKSLCASVNDTVSIKVLSADEGQTEDSKLISDLTQDKNYTWQW